MSQNHQDYWYVTEDEVESIALGAGILGTGGGGNPYLGKLHLWEVMRRGGRPKIVSPDQVPDDTQISTVGMMGAPTVGIERLAEGEEMIGALSALEKHLGVPIPYVISGEIGSANSLSALLVSVLSGRIAVDGDGMGRAFPELQMNTFVIDGIPVHPLALCDVRGQTTIVSHVLDAKWGERIARAVTVQMGGASGLAARSMTGAEMKRAAVWDTMSLAKRLGEVVREARTRRDDPVEATAGATNGQILFRGKVVDVSRRMVAGFARGQMRLRAHSGSDELDIEFQNENLIARRDGDVLASVPDLITLVTEDNGEPVSTEVLRYGLRVAVLGMPCTPQLRTETALLFVGPRAFGYEIEYKPLAGKWPGRVN
jgi:DUF917 family protein